MTLLDRFLKYVRIDTTSDPESETSPSCPQKELPFADMLVSELKEIGLADAERDEYGYVMATIPSTIDNYKGKVIGYIAHMDTAQDAPGDNIQPRVVKNYDGGDIVLDADKQIVLSPTQFPDLKKHVGKTLVVTDGRTLLGADDKAGVACIMTLAQYLTEHPEIQHGPIRIGFTPDEEIGRGVEHFDVKKFGADFGYTLDGGTLGGMEYENFNAASCVVNLTGVSMHPGAAKGKMISSLLVGMEFQHLLPVYQRPECTEGYEGFIHLLSVNGTVEHTQMAYIIRDHDMKKFEEKKAFMGRAADFLNAKYGEGTVKVEIKDSYFNMKEKVEPYPYVLDLVTDTLKEMGITPEIEPIRGGTDGATLSYMGLPCPNIATGGANAHSHFEYACVEDMEKNVEVIARMAQKASKL